MIFSKSPSLRDKKLFAYVMLAQKMKDLDPKELGECLYSLEKSNFSDECLCSLFQNQYQTFMNTFLSKSIFDKSNCSFEFFFEYHNPFDDSFILPGQIMSARVFFQKGIQKKKALVKTPLGTIQATVFLGLDEKDLDLKNYVLVHGDVICWKLSEKEYETIIKNYFS
ncbi:MAG: hypothetical protein QW097_00505 [archaeon]